MDAVITLSLVVVGREQVISGIFSFELLKHWAGGVCFVLEVGGTILI